MAAGFDGFRYFHDGHWHGYALEEHFEALRAIFTTREGCAPVPGEGRGGLYRFTFPGGDGFLRVYRRGGAVRHVIRETYFLQNRALAELRVHHALQRAGLPVAPLLGAVWMRIGPGYRGAFATRALAGRSLLAALQAGPVLKAELAACGALVRRMHDLGAFHADLNAANLFLAPGGPCVLDLDKARLTPRPLPEPLRARNLARLKRSFEKNRLPEAAFAAIFAAY